MTQVAAAIAIHDGKVLVTRRAAGQKLAGFWEFPGGKLEPGEDVRTCIVLELQEELGVASTAGKVLTVSEYTYSGGTISLIAIEVSLHNRDFTLIVHDEYLLFIDGKADGANQASPRSVAHPYSVTRGHPGPSWCLANACLRAESGR